MTEELKTCPFCGCSALVNGYPYDRPTMWMVECSSCSCAMGKEYDNHAMPDFDFGQEEQAIATWNNRALDREA